MAVQTGQICTHYMHNGCADGTELYTLHAQWLCRRDRVVHITCTMAVQTGQTCTH